MSANVINQVAYLRTSRSFPEDLHQIAVECNKCYVDVANAVNARTIGLYPATRPAITGNSYFIDNQRQQSIRQIYTFTNAGSIPHGINTTSIWGFTAIYGTFTNGTNFYPLPYVDVVLATNQINVIVDPTNIVITAGAGAPVITKGIVILEWLSLV